MSKNSEKKRYLGSVEEFTEYVAQVIRGEVDISHQYYDYGQNKPLSFETLGEAFDNYYWDGEGYAVNKAKLEIIQSFMRNSKTDSQIYLACLECLKWGAGNEGLGLYKKNKKWIDSKFPDGAGLKNNIEKASLSLVANNPDTSRFGSDFRMNAGFTKIYSLYNDDFIIYDGRVGAALGYLVTKYGQSRNLQSLPEELSFPYGNAQGSQNRNPSISGTIYEFKGLNNNHKKHAKWNVRANWVLASALAKAGGFKEKKGQEALRAVEAALFMVGYDFPNLSNKRTATRAKSDKNGSGGSLARSKENSETHSERVKATVDIYLTGGKNEFSPKDIFEQASSSGISITQEQVRFALLRDCVNCGSYYSGGNGYYKKVRRGIYKTMAPYESQG